MYVDIPTHYEELGVIHTPKKGQPSTTAKLELNVALLYIIIQ